MRNRPLLLILVGLGTFIVEVFLLQCILPWLSKLLAVVGLLIVIALFGI